MQNTYTYPEFAYRQSEAQRLGETRRHPLVIVGAGPIGLTAALDAAQRGIPTVVLDDNNTVSIGSRAVCYAKRPLEVWDRLGVADGFVERGVSWRVGKVFHRKEPVYQFNLLPEEHHKMPAMINLQQYYLEEDLVAACERAGVDLRWKHKLLSLSQTDDLATLTVETPDGVFRLEADWVLACDGANSDTRRMVGADFTGQFFQDRFLIADVVMQADFPTERWFWFDPPFHAEQLGADGQRVPTSVLLHKEADNVWRIDFQLGWAADPVEEKKPENVIPRIRAMLGPDVDFELEWVSIYQFACRRIDQFRHGRVIFAGDAAHQVSPFGARGANTGVQDADNLMWKLQLVIGGQAPLALIDSYHAERAFAADDNLRHSTRSTDFITPKSASSLKYRDAVLELARTEPFARPLVNSGRLSTPTPYTDSPLNTADTEAFAGLMRPGTNGADAPLRRNGQPVWLLNALQNAQRQGFVLLVFGAPGSAQAVEVNGVRVEVLDIALAGLGQTAPGGLLDAEGLAAQRYDAQPGTVYLMRPDQHVAARWRRFDAQAVQTALARALALPA